jgi:hypothetical protein
MPVDKQRCDLPLVGEGAGGIVRRARRELSPACADTWSHVEYRHAFKRVAVKRKPPRLIPPRYSSTEYPRLGAGSLVIRVSPRLSLSRRAKAVSGWKRVTYHFGDLESCLAAERRKGRFWACCESLSRREPGRDGRGIEDGIERKKRVVTSKGDALLHQTVLLQLTRALNGSIIPT